MPVQRLEPQEVLDRIDRGETFMFIDARDDFHWGASPRKLPGAVRVSVRAYEEMLGRLTLREPMLVYCATPREDFSARIARHIQDLGYQQVYVLKGGFDAWQDAEGPDEPKEDGERVEHGRVI